MAPAELRASDSFTFAQGSGDYSPPMVLSVSGDSLRAAQETVTNLEQAQEDQQAAMLAIVEQPAPPEPEPPAAQAAPEPRPAPAPAPAPPQQVARPAIEDLTPGDQVAATVSYYYCQRGTNPRGIGDGGGFCGAMRNGEIVFPGAAACAYQYLGQQFRIVGDPLERVYVCADTGSAVHGHHRDIWFMTSDEGMQWQAIMGRNITIEILE